jgi:hypothetical protein
METVLGADRPSTVRMRDDLTAAREQAQRPGQASALA